jgi:mannose/cellobiose epimerase-like protein (N-acyl-D-glucosamine 2-epimerase family)
MNRLNTTFRKTIITDQLKPKQIYSASQDDEAILWSNLHWLLYRYERRPEYRWIDTKCNLITGEDFPEEDPIKGSGAIYGWIQGRAMESLAGHARWLEKYAPTDEISRCIEKIPKILYQVIESIQTARSKNGGHLFYLMTLDGRPMTCDGRNVSMQPFLTADSPYNYSDLFTAKGLYAAAKFLGDDSLANEAQQYCIEVFKAIINRTFYIDQQQLNPDNPPQNIPGRHSQGPYMIQLGAAALLAEFQKDADSFNQGLTLIRYLFEHHVNLDRRWPKLQEYDFVEFIDNQCLPYEDGQTILCDPGHALEFVGLGLKFIEAAQKYYPTGAATRKILDEIAQTLLNVFRRHFELGFLDPPGGICKSVDLLTRRPINPQLTWWSLTEAIRAAARCLPIALTDQDREFFLDAWRQCHNTLLANYVRPDRSLICIQTRSSDGKIIDAIPGTADADPGYHTGLCLIESLQILNT